MNATQPAQEILKLIDKFKTLSYPDRELTKKLLQSLKLFDLVDLEIALNQKIPRERLAALKMIERYLDGLCSKDPSEFAEAKDHLRQLFYRVEEMDEEGFL